MGVNLHKEVSMTLQLTNQNHGFDENNSSVTNAQRPLARGRGAVVTKELFSSKPWFWFVCCSVMVTSL